jgi:hypothetical protein
MPLFIYILNLLCVDNWLYEFVVSLIGFIFRTEMIK